MSTASRSRGSASEPPAPDPFQYGWRFVKVSRPDGAVEHEQVALTLEDVLFPEVGDFIVHTVGHNSDVNDLYNVFSARLANKPTAVVLGDCRTDWNIPDVRPLGPDISVFFGVSHYEDWATFDVGLERAKPALVVEVASPNTRSNDVGPKVEYYYQAGVPVYIIADVDENEQERHIELIGYRKGRGGFKRMKLNEERRIWLEAVGLWLGVTKDPRGGFYRLACFDPETGEEIGDYMALAEQLAELRASAEAESRARAEAEARAMAEAAKRAELERQVKQLQAEMERLRRGE